MKKMTERYEYKQEHIPHLELVEILNELGEQGWEVIETSLYTIDSQRIAVLLKRRYKLEDEIWGKMRTKEIKDTKDTEDTEEPENQEIIGKKIIGENEPKDQIKPTNSKNSKNTIFQRH